MQETIIRFVLAVLDSGKWFIAFFILWPFFRSTWLFWRQENYKHSSEFRMGMLEIRIPREIRKSPRGMEQILMSIHALRNTGNDLREIWWDGEITRWFALEMVSFGGEVRFFIRFPHRQRPMVESAFFSYYPDVELVEVDDYIDNIPNNMDEVYARGYDLWGSEMKLAREAAYPIRSYTEFEAPDEERQYDPISAFLEVLGKVKKEEIVGVQLLVAPALDDWHEKWKPLVEKLKDQTSKKKPAYGTAVEFQGGILPAFSVTKGADDPFASLKMTRTPGETNVLEAVENNLSKPAFETTVRFIYLSPSPLFYDSFARRGLTGVFNQYAALDLNFFKQNYAISTRTRFWNWPHIFPKRRGEYRKAWLLHQYRHREMPHHTFAAKLVSSKLFRWSFPSKTVTLNVESLATLYHPPTFLALTAPHIKRLESKKAGPPAGLVIYGSEKEIERFQ